MQIVYFICKLQFTSTKKVSAASFIAMLTTGTSTSNAALVESHDSVGRTQRHMYALKGIKMRDKSAKTAAEKDM